MLVDGGNLGRTQYDPLTGVCKHGAIYKAALEKQ